MDIAKAGGYNPISNRSARQEAISPQQEETSGIELVLKDTVEISAEGKQKIEKSNSLFFDVEQLREQLKNSNEQIKAEAGANKIRLKCREIARRIMKGDIVPKEDHSYLIKNNPGLYMQATSMIMHNDDPKKHRRLSKDDESGVESGIQISQTGQANVTPVSDSPVATTSETSASSE